MSSLAFFNITDHTKKHIRRRLECEFGDSLRIINDKGKLLVMPDNLTRDELAKQNFALTEQLTISKGDEKDVNKLPLRTALCIREEVKQSEYKKASTRFY